MVERELAHALQVPYEYVRFQPHVDVFATSGVFSIASTSTATATTKLNLHRWVVDPYARQTMSIDCHGEFANRD